MSWFDARRVTPPIDERARAMGILPDPSPADGYPRCDACGVARWPQEVEAVKRSDTLLVICKTPGPCIAAARAAGLWMI